MVWKSSHSASVAGKVQKKGVGEWVFFRTHRACTLMSVYTVSTMSQIDFSPERMDSDQLFWPPVATKKIHLGARQSQVFNNK